MGIAANIIENLGNVFISAGITFFMVALFRYIALPKIIKPEPVDVKKVQRIELLRTVARKTLKQQKEFLDLTTEKRKEPWWILVVFGLIAFFVTSAVMLIAEAYDLHANVGVGVLFMLFFPFVYSLGLRLCGVRVKSTVLDLIGW